MKCPYCESQDIRSYIDRDCDLSWYLCGNCGYQGYDLRLFHDAWSCEGYTTLIYGIGEIAASHIPLENLLEEGIKKWVRRLHYEV